MLLRKISKSNLNCVDRSMTRGKIGRVYAMVIQGTTPRKSLRRWVARLPDGLWGKSVHLCSLQELGATGGKR